VEAVLGRLIERELATRLARRPGQKEERYAQLLGGEVDEAATSTFAPPATAFPAPAPSDELEALRARVDRLEDEVASLRAALDDVRGRSVAD
ncbi:MAG TPA: hypothetical protein VFT33_05170, partial [Gaiellaceae bacterium]|nr:hypothetical protein [Gaiellaceae bacterium]